MCLPNPLSSPFLLLSWPPRESVLIAGGWQRDQRIRLTERHVNPGCGPSLAPLRRGSEKLILATLLCFLPSFPSILSFLYTETDDWAKESSSLRSPATCKLLEVRASWVTSLLSLQLSLWAQSTGSHAVRCLQTLQQRCWTLSETWIKQPSLSDCQRLLEVRRQVWWPDYPCISAFCIA